MRAGYMSLIFNLLSSAQAFATPLGMSSRTKASCNQLAEHEKSKGNSDLHGTFLSTSKLQ